MPGLFNPGFLVCENPDLYMGKTEIPLDPSLLNIHYISSF